MSSSSDKLIVFNNLSVLTQQEKLHVGDYIIFARRTTVSSLHTESLGKVYSVMVPLKQKY